MTTSDLAASQADTGHPCDDEPATVVLLARTVQRPLPEGDTGAGRTALAASLAEAPAESLVVPLVRLPCNEGLDATRALHDRTSRGRCSAYVPSRPPLDPSARRRGTARTPSGRHVLERMLQA